MTRTATLLVAVLFLLAAGTASAKDGPAVRLRDSAVFEVTGLDAADLARLAKANLDAGQWAALFAVYVEDGKATGSKDRPAVVGSYRVADGVLRFEPRYPPVPGVRYRAVFDPSRLPGGGAGKVVTAELLVPKPAAKAATVVEHVYPTCSELPENQLKFYLHFSAPMSRGQAYRHVRLLDAKGKAIEVPFLELDEELWDPPMQRFTLFIDPGRIKRGLKPREEDGPVLEAGKSYTLVIDQRWTDADGNPLKESFRKSFRVAGPQEEPIDLKTWKVQAAAAGGKDPLTLTFPRPLDHALLQRVVWVVDADGRKVAGTVTVTHEETRWHFTPERPWQAGTYRVVVDAALEDLAGNGVDRQFEVDVFRPIPRKVETKTHELPFRIGTAK